MHWPTLLALAVLCQPGLAYIGGYEEGAAERPTNVTGLHYQYYSSIGSYYNGTLTIKIHPVYNPPPRYQDFADHYVCEEYENKTFEVEMNAMAALKMPPPKSAPHVNPFFLDIKVWPKPYELRLPRTDNYTTDEAFSILSESGLDSGPRWLLNMSTPRNTTSSGSSTSGASSTATTNTGYRFSGEANTNDTLWDQTFVFNVTDTCKPLSSLDELLYSGNFLRPDDMDSDLVYDWVTRELRSLPSVYGSFDGETAQVQLSGAFSAHPRGGNEIVGRAELVFSGRIDAERSDELLLGRTVPEWNATLGFGDRAGVAGLGNGGSRAEWSGLLLGLVGLMGVLAV
ncbi:hypothetical protein BJX66DRAFT_312186 [Aspergillus keveii]|uniref:Uncharacterized protein n=1 Tax=Aspergillus keveii TaxID=714993 RepID=A0ABR4FU19_9EURO